MKQITQYSVMAAVTIAAVLVFTCVFKPIIVSGESMEPTFHDGNYLVMFKLAQKDSLEKEDIVVFDYDHQKLIKRVIGVEGDNIRIYKNNVYVNGQILKEPYVKDDDFLYEKSGIWTVPENSVFVLGDNRGNSLDSRSSEIGFIDFKDINGKVIFSLKDIKR